MKTIAILCNKLSNEVFVVIQLKYRRFAVPSRLITKQVQHVGRGGGQGRLSAFTVYPKR
jgi:hypothetical protein